MFRDLPRYARFNRLADLPIETMGSFRPSGPCSSLWFDETVYSGGVDPIAIHALTLQWLFSTKTVKADSPDHLLRCPGRCDLETCTLPQF
jgi:hypothetical protein